MRASHWGSLLELELLFRGEVVAGLVWGEGDEVSPYLVASLRFARMYLDRSLALRQAPCLGGVPDIMTLPPPPPPPGDVLVTL